MTTSEQPITRSELREELQLVLQHYATKADLADLKSEIKVEVADLKAESAELRGELKSIRWTISLMGIGLSILMVAMRFLDAS